MEMHRFQVATGVKQIGKRRILTGFHVFAGFDRKHVLELLEAYLDNHYDLSRCTVLSNSDGGSGYTTRMCSINWQKAASVTSISGNGTM